MFSPCRRATVAGAALSRHQRRCSRESCCGKLRAAGAVIIGKLTCTRWPTASRRKSRLGDCLQPGRRGALTGGSSRRGGQRAEALPWPRSVQTRRINPRTRRTVRTGGYRASLGRGNCRAAAHLAQSFDIWDAVSRPGRCAAVSRLLRARGMRPPTHTFTRFAVRMRAFFYDCEPGLSQACMPQSSNWRTSTERDRNRRNVVGRGPSISMRPFRRGSSARPRRPLWPL